MKILYTRAARRDLREIYEYIAYSLLVPGTARALTERIMAEARTLADFAERNPLYRDEPWHSRGLRFMTVKKYLVFYTVDRESGTVFIARILYGGRDISRQLEETEMNVEADFSTL